MSAEPVADHSFSPRREWRNAVALTRLLKTGVDRRRGVAIDAFMVAPAALSGSDGSAFRAEGAR